MADAKISALTANSPLDFTEVVPIVQGGSTKKMALSELSGRLFARSAGLWYPLANSAVAVSGSNDTNENTLATVTVPAGAMGANGALRIWTLWTFTNNANAKTPRIRLGGASGTIWFAANAASAATGQFITIIRNRNAANSQVGFQTGGTNWGVSATACQTGTTDTASAQDLVITVQKGTGTDTMTLEAYTVELYYKA